MKAIFSSLLLVSIILCGCSTLTNQVTTGRDFDETKTNQLKKGTTKADDVVALYGEPDKKEIVSGTDIMWHYTYMSKVTKTHSGMFAPVVVTVAGYEKKLDLLLQNDVVINFTYVKVPITAQTETSGGMITSQ